MRLLHAATAACLLLLTACGTDADVAGGGDTPVTAEDPADEPGPAAGACLEGTPDCDDTPDDGAGLEPGGGFDEEAARRDAESLLGQPEEEVLELWGDVRVGRRGDEHQALTDDHAPGRKTIATDDDGTGTYRVVEVVLELPEGSVTFTTP